VTGALDGLQARMADPSGQLAVALAATRPVAAAGSTGQPGTAITETSLAQPMQVNDPPWWRVTIDQRHELGDDLRPAKEQPQRPVMRDHRQSPTGLSKIDTWYPRQVKCAVPGRH
jgi:hypothetical protein